MRKSMKKAMATIAALTLAFSFAATAMPDTASAVECSKAGKKAGKKDFDPDGTYNAYFVFQQTESWVFRNAWYEPTLGKDGNLFKGDASFDKMLTTLDVSDAIPVGGTVVDAEIKGNGTYTVGVNDFDTTKLDPDAANISLIGFSTDIPHSALDNGLQITDVKLSMDGIEKWAGEPFVNVDAQNLGLLEMDVVNTYQKEGYETPSVTLPQGSIEITFTVSGFNYDNPDAVATTDETTTSDGADDSTAAVDEAATNESSGVSGGVVAIIVIVVIVVIAGVVIVIRKKKN